MTKSNVTNRTIFTGDNLRVLRGLNEDSVDLIYLDPPFNSNRDYSAPIGSEAAGAAFKDTWTLSDVDAEWLGEIADREPALNQIIAASGLAHSKSMMSYLIMMSVRMLEMRRVLRPTGSIYLHVDPTASHYLKTMMDCVFGRGDFRNEIIWGYPPTGQPPKQAFPRKHDSILFYAADGATFETQYGPMTESTLKSFSAVDADGRRYSKAHGKRTYLDKSKGRAVPSWWTDIGSGSTMPKRERCGYPTQKPLALLERIIRASSNEGDVVLDPFCGCATTCVAAEKLDRHWIGCDLSPLAVRLVRERLERQFGRLTFSVVHREDIPRRTDEGPLPNYRTHKHTLYGRQEGVCRGCEVHFPFRNFTVDHIVPQRDGGTDHISNLQLLCGACNSAKGTRSMTEFRARRMNRIAGGIQCSG